MDTSHRLNTSASCHVLIVDSAKSAAESLAQTLAASALLNTDQMYLITESSLEAALGERLWDLVLYCVTMPSARPSEIFRLVQQAQPQTPVIVVSSGAVLNDAVNLMRLGAKGVVERQDTQRLLELVSQELASDAQQRREQQFRAIQHDLEENRSQFHHILDMAQDAGYASRDVTERVQAETALKASEEKFRSLIESVDAAISTVSLDGRYLYLNSVAARPYGVSPSALVGTTVHALFPPDQADQIMRDVRHVITHNLGMTLEPEVNIAGTRRWFRTNIQPVRDNSGQPYAALIYATDITDKKEAEFALLLSEQRMRLFVEHTPAAIAMFDQNMIYLAASRRFITDYHLNETSLIGRSHYEVFPEIPERWKEIHRRCLGGATEQCEADPFPRADGSLDWVRWEIHPWHDHDGKIGGILMFTEVITERILAGEALRASEEKYRSLIESSDSIISMLDENGQVLYSNEIAARALHQMPTSIVGKTIHELFPPQIANDQLASIQTVIKTGAGHVDESFSTVEGEPRWYRTSIQPVHDASGKVTAALINATDITAFKAAEEELRKAHDLLEQRVIERTTELKFAKDRFEAIFDHSGDAVLLLHVEQGIRQANYAFEQMFGVEADRYLDTKLSAWIQPDQAEAVETIIQEAARTHQVQHVEATTRRSNGADYFIEISMAPVNRSHNAVTNLVCVLHDITKRKKAEEALRESEARYRLLAENVKDVIIKLSPDGIVTFVTPSLYGLLAYKPEDALGHPGFELVHPEDALASLEIVSTSLSAKAPSFTLTERLHHKDGHYVWVEVTNTNVYDPVTGQLVEMVGVLRDITERKQAEEVMRASEEKFRRFIESAPIATIITNDFGEIVLVNNEAEKLFSYPRAELVGQMIEVLVPEEARRNHVAHRFIYETNPEARRTGVMELTARRRDGNIFPADIQLSYIDIPSGNLVMSFISDTTQRKQAETTLKQALAQEKELGELKSRFVSMASHEFRTPLAAILATTETLTFYRDQMDKPQIDERLDRIRLQVSHMKDIMEDVLQLARIQAGRVEFRPSPGDVHRLCQEIVEELESQPEFRGRLMYEYSNAPVLAEFDERLLRQVISNLAHNALKYSGDEKPVLMSLKHDESHLHLTVADEGIGIPPDDLKHLFEPFHRARNVGAIPGTGLGMTIAKQAVELHGGTITVDSEVGRGTIFRVVIPKYPPKVGDGAGGSEAGQANNRTGSLNKMVRE